MSFSRSISAKNIRWQEGLRKAPKEVIANKGIIKRSIEWQTDTVLEGVGTPLTFWKYNPHGDECFCYKDNIPDSRHELCYGTGFLNGYQKYGYKTITWAISSKDLILNNVRVNSDNKFILKQGTEGYIETPWVELIDLKEFTYFKTFEEKISPPNSWIETQFSIDGINWIDFTSINILPFTEKIKFRVHLKRSSYRAVLPSIGYFRFRYRNVETLLERTNKFNINVPAILAIKPRTERVMELNRNGVSYKFPIRFLVRPEFRFESKDICMFLNGTYKDMRFFTENNNEVTIGENQDLLFVEFDVRFVYSYEDVTGIVYKLD